MRVILHKGDCREVLPRLRNEGFRADLLLTDPPYNISSRTATIVSGKRFNKHYEPKFEFDHTIEPEEWIPLAAECLKENAVFVTFAAFQQVGRVMDILQDIGFRVRHLAAWRKLNPIPQLRKKQWATSLEHIVIATRGKKYHYNWREGHHTDVIEAPVVQGRERVHPTQKPVKVLKDIIRWWSFRGDTVLDPFAGSGSTGVAAVELGRSFVGIEVDEKWHRAASKRIPRYLPLDAFLRTRSLDAFTEV